MLNNKECFIFKDLYAAYIDEEVEGETVEWIERHLKSCEMCRNWARDFQRKSNNKIEEINNSVIEHEDESEKKVIKRAKILLFTSLIIVVILAVWMSLWIFT